MQETVASTKREFKEVWEISERAIGSTTGMMKYLQENKDRRFWGDKHDG